MRLLLLSFLLVLTGCGLLNSSPSLDFDQLRGGLSSADARELLKPHHGWTCMEPNSGLGVGYCETALTELDGLKASKITIYFRDGKLLSAKIEYTPDGFDALAKMMDGKYKRNPPDAGGVTWAVAGGAVASSPTELEHGNVYAYWLSTKAIAEEMQR
jgi:hypothetical protein